jgi:hypothetical protein
MRNLLSHPLTLGIREHFQYYSSGLGHRKWKGKLGNAQVRLG